MSSRSYAAKQPEKCHFTIFLKLASWLAMPLISRISFSPASYANPNAEQNAAQSRLLELKKALKENAPDGKLEPSYAHYLESELRELAVHLQLGVIKQFQSEISAARFRFVMADIDLALGIAQEFVKAENHPAAETHFERARQLVHDYNISSIDIEARIRKAKTDAQALQSKN